jgi:hypothetical protein
MLICPLACANWNNGSIAGAWTTNLNNARTNSNSNVGFRADCGIASRPVMGVVEPQGFRFLPGLAKSANGLVSSSLRDRHEAVLW